MAQPSSQLFFMALDSQKDQPPSHGEDEKSGSVESKNSKSEASSVEAQSGQKSSIPEPGAGFPANPFDLSAMSSLLMDPSIKGLSEQIATAFSQMAEQLQKSVHGTEDGLPQFDTQQYYSTMQQLMKNPKFMTTAEHLGNSLIQDPSMSRMREDFANPLRKEKHEEQMTRIKDPYLSVVHHTASVGDVKDPSIKELAEQIVKDSTFIQMAEQFRKSLFCTKDGLPLFDTQDYYSTMQQVIQNPHFMTMAERCGNALIQDPSLKPIQEEIESGGQAAMMRYWNVPEVLQKLGQALGLGVSGEVTTSTELTGPNDAEDETGNEDESIVHHMAGKRARSSIENLDGKTPIDVAKLNNQQEDPSIKELAEQIAKNLEQLQKSVHGTEDGLPQFDTQECFSAMQQVIQDPQFMTMAERLGNALIQDPSMSSKLKNLTNPLRKEEHEEHMTQDPSLKLIQEEIERGGQVAMMRYWNVPEVLQKLGQSMGLRVSGEVATSTELTGSDDAEDETGNEDESIVHHTAGKRSRSSFENLEGKMLNNKQEVLKLLEKDAFPQV